MNVDSFQESTVNTGRVLTLVVGLRAGHRVGRGSHGLLLSGEFAFAHARQSLLLRVATRLQHGAALDLGDCEIKLHMQGKKLEKCTHLTKFDTYIIPRLA